MELQTYGHAVYQGADCSVGCHGSDYLHDTLDAQVIADLIRYGNVDRTVTPTKKLKNDPVFHKDIAKRARKVFEAYYDVQIVIDSFEKFITEVVEYFLFAFALSDIQSLKVERSLLGYRKGSYRLKTEPESQYKYSEG